MPNYTFRNIETNETTTIFMKMSELDCYIKDNPNWTQVLSASAIIDPTKLMGVIQKDQGWKDVLSQIKKNNYGSTINEEGI